MTTNIETLKNAIFGELSQDELRLQDQLAKAFKTESQRIRLSNQLRAAIADKGLTQRQLAQTISMQPADLSRLLAGKTNMTIDVLSRITTELGLELTLKTVS